jgi:hypothetical protein
LLYLICSKPYKAEAKEREEEQNLDQASPSLQRKDRDSFFAFWFLLFPLPSTFGPLSFTVNKPCVMHAYFAIIVTLNTCIPPPPLFFCFVFSSHSFVCKRGEEQGEAQLEAES